MKLLKKKRHRCAECGLLDKWEFPVSQCDFCEAYFCNNHQSLEVINFKALTLCMYCKDDIYFS